MYPAKMLIIFHVDIHQGEMKSNQKLKKMDIDPH